MEMILSRWTADPKMDKDLPVVHVGPSSDQEIEHLVKEAQQKAWANVGMLVLVILGYIALVCLLGFLYTKLWADPVLGDIKAKEADSFSHGAFSCHEDLHVSLLSFCCMPFRWADTMKAAGLLGFWTALLLFMLVAHLRAAAQDYGPMMGLAAWLCSTAFFTYYRQQLRALFSIKNDTMDKVKNLHVIISRRFCTSGSARSSLFRPTCENRFILDSRSKSLK